MIMFKKSRIKNSNILDMFWVCFFRRVSKKIAFSVSENPSKSIKIDFLGT